MPPNSPFLARTVIEAHAVTEAVREWCGKYPRLEEAFEGYKWRLARGPQAGYVFTANQAMRVIKFPDYGSPGTPGYVPTVTIRYSFSNNEVTFLGIQIIP